VSVRIDELLAASRDILTDNAIPRAVAGGWALDLFLGRQTREHAESPRLTDEADFRVASVRLVRESRNSVSPMSRIQTTLTPLKPAASQPRMGNP
jgi:hypothetical protein